ncbi:MAG: hypothetical protein ACREJO_04130 [Phycisphaerales bacterium]
MDSVSPVNAGAAALAGLERARAQADEAAVRIAGVFDPEASADIGDVARDSVELTSANVAVAANVKVLKVQQEMMGQLLDLMG